MLLLLSNSMQTFFKINFSKYSFRNTITEFGLDPVQDRHSVGPDLGLICLQRLSAEDKSCLYHGQSVSFTLKSVSIHNYSQCAHIRSNRILSNSQQTFFKINFFKIFFQKHYQRVKPFGSSSGSTECRS